MEGDRFHAAAAYVNDYLKPAAAYRAGRMSRYLQGGVAPLKTLMVGRRPCAVSNHEAAAVATSFETRRKGSGEKFAMTR